MTPPREDLQTNTVDGAAAFERGRALDDGAGDLDDWDHNPWDEEQDEDEDEELECRCGDGACPECCGPGIP